MKKLLFIIAALSFAWTASAQAPQGVNYQAVARNASGNLIANTALNVRITVSSGTGGSTQEYQETHGVTTNDYGLFSLKVGKGAPLSGTFNAISWGSDEHHLTVEVDDGSGFIDMGTTQMMSVPYALYAETSGSGGGSLALNDLTDVNTTGVTTNQVLSWDGSNWVPITTSGGTTYSAGSGLTLSGTTFINAAPDVPVTLTGGGSTSISGTYPNFNITSTDNNTTYTAGTALTLSGTTFSAQNTSGIWNANQLRGRTVSSNAPTTGQVLEWSGSQWVPATVAGGSSLWTANGSNVYRNSGYVGVGLTNPLHALHIVGTTTYRGLSSDWSTSTAWNDYVANYFNSTGGATTNTLYSGVRSHIQGTDGYHYGFYGISDGNSAQGNRGAYGFAKNGASNRGIHGVTEGNGTSLTNTGVFGYTAGTGSNALGDWNTGTRGLVDGSGYVNSGLSATNSSTARYNNGVYGLSNGAGDASGSSNNTAFYGSAEGNADDNFGVQVFATGTSGNNYGIYASASNGTTNYAGYFVGDVFITGNISKASGTFKIDHPLDPANKFLVHSFVESPDMMNVYSGNVTTDANGEATVELPEYFEASNKDFRYQLTPIGQFAQLIIFEEIENNQFKVKSDIPNVKLSWTVIATRNDKYAQEHRIVDEVEKEGDDKGKYLHPELYGIGIDQAIYNKGKKLDNQPILNNKQ